MVITSQDINYRVGSFYCEPKWYGRNMVKNNIMKIRESRGLSREQLADRLGVSTVTIFRKETGERGLRTQELEKYANALGVEPSDIIADAAASRQSPVVGDIGAGERFYPYDDHAKGDGFEMVDTPENCNDCVAVRIRGDSMKPFKSGWLIFYERYADGVPSDCLNELCVVKCADESMMLKVVKSGSLPHHYHLLSFNEAYKPIIDQKLLWASKVKNIRPN
jgi:transcriptional regulator with XRE-family HTH domain